MEWTYAQQGAALDGYSATPHSHQQAAAADSRSHELVRETDCL